MNIWHLRIVEAQQEKQQKPAGQKLEPEPAVPPAATRGRPKFRIIPHRPPC